jgi:predicted RNA binding protein YcfA (HicA-like mRNA interferase family)
MNYFYPLGGFLASVPLPVVTGKEMKKFLLKMGYDLVKIKGSHHLFKRMDGKGYKISVPIHANEPIADGTLNNIIEFFAKNEGLTEDQVRRILLEL